jgi:hypothetical protein
MGKTRRKLYGKRRRRQRGGGRLWWTLLAALAAAEGATAKDPTIRALASKWWFDGGWDNSKALADGLTKAIPTFTLPDRIFDVKADALWDAPPPATEMSEEQKELVEPYLTEVDVKGLREGDGTRYTYQGREFSVNTWKNLGSEGVEISPEEGEAFIVKDPLNARFQVVPDQFEGGRRRRGRKQRRKTLRRK